MAQTWPETVNTKIYNYKPTAPKFDIISDPSDVGDPKERSRWNGYTQFHEWSMWMTIDEFHDFQAWYRVTLGGGVLSFIFPRPLALDDFNGEVADFELVFFKNNGTGYSIDHYDQPNNKVKITFKTREV